MRSITEQERTAFPAEDAPGAPEAGAAETAGFSASAARRETAAGFTRRVAGLSSGALDCPLPGLGRTAARFTVLTSVAEEDLCVARLFEGHVDAVAILAELGAPAPRPGERWGVWAAEPPGEGLTATRTERGWLLNGLKQYCSGAHNCTHALVTAKAADGKRLFAVRTGVGVGEAGSRRSGSAGDDPARHASAAGRPGDDELSGPEPSDGPARGAGTVDRPGDDELAVAGPGEGLAHGTAAAKAGCHPVAGSWQALGMAGSDTPDVRFHEVAAVPVGGVGAYLTRPGFQHGGIGVAACWHGGARAVADVLLKGAAARGPDPLTDAHLGAVDMRLHAAETVLRQAADEIDLDPSDTGGGARVRSLRVRAFVESVCADVLTHVGRATGAGPLCHDERHARNAADLAVYIRQHHAERNLAELGGLVAREASS
jgi:alkylation response protein AidB-like acyl-CoA dehydrogenase